MDKNYSDWFAENTKPLERAYLRGASPWERSGVGLHTQRDYEYWRTVRKPIADCIDRSGSVLDIGCANGFLLESLREWKREEGIELELFGLEISEKMLREARDRVHNGTFYNANVWGWKAPRRFDFVITELVYVPDEVRQFYLAGLLDEAVAEGGKLIVTQYSSDGDQEHRLMALVETMGFKMRESHDARWEGKLKTEVVAIVMNRNM